jgi:hypothetical protein
MHDVIFERWNTKYRKTLAGARSAAWHLPILRTVGHKVGQLDALTAV